MSAVRDAAGRSGGEARSAAPAAPVRRPSRAARLLAGATRHWPVLALLASGAALRAVTALAYRPALIYWDSTRYLEAAEDLRPGLVRPLGYPALLAALPLEHGLAVVPVLQHAMGLALGALLYALLVRLGVARGLAALAAAPVLLDAYQLLIEQYLLSEALFQLLVVGAAAALLWRRPPGPAAAALAGVLFAAAALTRGSGVLLVAPALAAVLALRARPAAVAALLLAFAIPVAAYAAWFHSLHGAYALTGYGGRFLYARVAPFADCARFPVPAAERPLCPSGPPATRPTVEEYMWDNDRSPVYRLKHDRQRLAGSFARRVIAHQPADYARAVGEGLLRGFAPARTEHERELPISRWQFQLEFPVYRAETLAVLERYGGDAPRVDRGLATLLRGYGRFGYAPGPLMALAVAAAFLAVLGAGRARRSGLRVPAFLLVALGLVVLLTAVGVNQFTWRYWLPVLVLFPPAGAVGVTALLGLRRDRALSTR